MPGRFSPMFRMTTFVEPHITVGDTTITPVSKAFTVGCEGGRCGVWLGVRRPSAVLVTRDGGDAVRMPVVDATRLAQLFIIGVAFLCVWQAWIWTKKRKGYRS
jgi:hypothetical protein